MQPFETDKVKPQATYPTLDQNAQQGQHPQTQQPQAQHPQAQYPQAQQTGYPTFQQGTQKPYPPNYQPPFPSQGYQQPAGYPNYQAQQPNYMAYNQGVNQAQNTVQKQLLAQQLSRNNQASGGGLVVIYSLVLCVGAAALSYTVFHQDNYQMLGSLYNQLSTRTFQPQDIFSPDTCTAFLAGILDVPILLGLFCVLNILSLLIACTGTNLCMCFQGFFTLVWAGIAVFTSQQKCLGYNLLTKAFGANNIPQNASPYYAGMAIASLIACLLNYSWGSNQDKAKRDQRNLALMMAAS